MSPKPARQRLDNRLVELGLATSRSQAQALIMAGLVLVDDVPATKAALTPPSEARITLKKTREHPYASRGGLKLSAGLDFFSLDPRGLRCLDVGASSGGFTDCLLQRGAAEVVAVDVGYGQLAWELRQDPRVTVLERTNARYLTAEQIHGPVGAAVADVSFISLTLILPAVLPLITSGGWLAALIKPQFEVGKGQVGKGGVVRDPELKAGAVAKIVDFLTQAGAQVLGTCPSPVLGPKGNEEFLVGARV